MPGTPIRLSPSGPVIGNTGGAPLGFGPGAILRLTEAQSVMSGTLIIPTIPGLICPDGFGQTDAIVLTLDAPKEALEYRANLKLDVLNTSTNTEGQVTLFLDVSVDGGATYTVVAKNTHKIAAVHPSLTEVSEAREMSVNLPLATGLTLGVTDALPTPTPSIKLRARAQSMTIAVQPTVDSLGTITGDAGTVAGLNGTVHMELMECF
jgi:hypothetical protein